MTLAAWRSNTVQVADDYLQADGTLDPAGNFPELAEAAIALQPAGLKVLRDYYGATKDFSGLPDELRIFFQGISGWFVGDPATANQRTIDYANSGPALFTFTGHANHYHYATVCPLGVSKSDPDADTKCGQMLNLYDPGSLH